MKRSIKTQIYIIIGVNLVVFLLWQNYRLTRQSHGYLFRVEPLINTVYLGQNQGQAHQI